MSLYGLLKLKSCLILEEIVAFYINKVFVAGYPLTPSVVEGNHDCILYCILYGFGKKVSVFLLKMPIVLTWFMSYPFSTFQIGESTKDESRSMWNLTQIFLSYKTVYLIVLESFPPL